MTRVSDVHIRIYLATRPSTPKGFYGVATDFNKSHKLKVLRFVCPFQDILVAGQIGHVSKLLLLYLFPAWSFPNVPSV